MVKKTIQRKILNTTQLLINFIYEQNGLTNEVLDLQIKLNILRSKLDIPDPNELIDEKGFVQ